MTDNETTDSVPDGVQTDRVDVDPDLFGEFPDGPIEDITADGQGPVEKELVHEWTREVTLIQLTGSCPQCDGTIEYETEQSGAGETVVTFSCVDCDEEWVAVPDAIDGPVRRENFKHKS
jgi:hypothetical protein